MSVKPSAKKRLADGSPAQTATYTYAYDGSRLSKTVGKTSKSDGIKTEYILNGSLILAQNTTYPDGSKETLNFYYSSDGKLLEIGYLKSGTDGIIDKDATETHYSVIRNAMGDVAALYTADGTLVGTYEYDPYGLPFEPVANKDYVDNDDILKKNPFRYRGYYYDQETGWYYLQSRYYDPEVKRFVSIDDPSYLRMGYGINNYNLFSYCDNDPISKRDDSGRFPLANIPFLGDYIETKYTELTGITKEEHLGRNKYNNWGDSIDDIYTYDSNTGEIVLQKGWTEAKITENVFHIHYSEEQQIGLIPEYLFNKKYLHENEDGTSYEVVVCQLPSWLATFDNTHDGDYIVDDKINGGTFNFTSHLSDPQGHTMNDVLPYFIWGN